MNLYLTKLANLDPQIIKDRFHPDLTPEQMDVLGVLAKQYYGKDPKQHNFFQIDASLEKWPEYWKNEEAPMGWYDWYNQYQEGRRSDDDARQMRRWYLYKQRHLGGLRKADPSLSDLSVQPKRRQALLNWGIAPGIDVDVAMEHHPVNKYLEHIEKKATLAATVDGTGNTPAQASAGSTLQGTQNKNTPRPVRNKMLEAGRETDTDDPINMGSRTHFSDGYVG